MDGGNGGYNNRISRINRLHHMINRLIDIIPKCCVPREDDTADFSAAAVLLQRLLGKWACRQQDLGLRFGF